MTCSRSFERKQAACCERFRMPPRTPVETRDEKLQALAAREEPRCQDLHVAGLRLSDHTISGKTLEVTYQKLMGKRRQHGGLTASQRQGMVSDLSRVWRDQAAAAVSGGLGRFAVPAAGPPVVAAQPGDVVVVDARGDMGSGVFGDMMLTYFKGRGGLGVIVDGCIRDFPKVQRLGLGLWLRGVTPNFHTQTRIYPFAVNVPIACGDTLVMPGDIIVADDDGAVVVPIGLAPQILEKASAHAEWEDFSRMKLLEGGDLRKYYPLTDEAREEYEAWAKRPDSGLQT